MIGGEEKLLVAAREIVALGSSEPAQDLQRRVFDGRVNTDDVATLVISASESSSSQFTFTFSAVPMAVPLVRRSLQRFIVRLGYDEDARFAILTAAGEAIANAVEHAYVGAPGIVRLHAEVHDHLLAIVVEDDGRWKPAQRRDDRGRGLPLMRALMDAVEIRTNQARTEVRLTIGLGEQRTA